MAGLPYIALVGVDRRRGDALGSIRVDAAGMAPHVAAHNEQGELFVGDRVDHVADDTEDV